MTEPEQWAVELWHRFHRAYLMEYRESHQQGVQSAALTIQRAFEERMKNPGYLKGHFFSADPRSQALKDTTHD